MREEPKGCEQVEDGIKAARPPRRHLAHVAARVAEILPATALTRHVEQVLRVVEPVDIVPEFSEQMRVPTLSAGHIEDARADR
jgi:hypothetical protein